MLGARSATIIGVLEPSVPYPAETEIIANVVTSPHHLDHDGLPDAHPPDDEAVRPPRPGRNLESARAELRAAHARILQEHPEAVFTEDGYRIDAFRLRDQITSKARTVLLVLLAASGLVFVIACSNVANLILAHSVHREGGLVSERRRAGPGALRSALLAESLLLCGAEPVAVVLNVGRGFRAPTAFDLFSNGVHEGTVRFERGDSTLKNETSINSDLALRVQTRNLTAELGGFANYINNFIFPDPSGEIDAASGFQIFDITQGDARLTGFEAAAEYHVTRYLHLRGTADYTRGQNTTTDEPLPFIPPFRATYSARLEAGRSPWFQSAYFSVGGESNSKQTQLDPEDFAPEGYTLANLGAGVTLPLGQRTFGIDLQLRNVFDKEYANFLSRYKTYAFDPGRNLVVRVSSEF